jgi:hypothetical protein
MCLMSLGALLAFSALVAGPRRPRATAA